MSWFTKNIVAQAAMVKESPVRTGWVPRLCPVCSHQRQQQPNCKLSIPQLRLVINEANYDRRNKSGDRWCWQRGVARSC